MAERETVPWGLVLAVGGLLAAAAFGMSAHSAFLTFEPLTALRGADLVAVVVADGAWILVATLVLMRTSASGAVRPALRRALLVNAALVLLVVGAPGSGIAELLSRTSTPGPVRAILEGDPWTTQLDVPGARYVLPALLVLAALAVVLGAGLLIWTLVVNRGRWFRHRSVRRWARSAGRGPSRSAAPEGVLDAVIRARRALASPDPSRQAVIAAYAAMEQAISARRGVREPTQTAAEVIDDALEHGVLRDRRAAGRLLRHFELARFSRGELPADVRATVEHDLALLQAELEGQVTPR